MGNGIILASNRPQSDTDFRKNEGIILEYNAETDSFCASSYTGKVFLFGEYLIDGIKYGVTNGWKMLSGTQNAAVAGKTIVTIWTGYSITPVGDDSQYITVKLESGASYVDEGVTYYKYDSEVTFGYEREGYKGIKYTLTNGEDSSYTGGPGAVFRTFAKI